MAQDKNESSPPSTTTRQQAPSVYDPFSTLRQQVDRLFDDFGRWPSLWGGEAARPMQEWIGGNWGAIDVSETDEAFRISVELPGCEEKDIDISARSDVLTIRAEKRAERSEEKKKNYHLTERRFGAFARSFRIPEQVDEEHISASFRNGVLELVMPKTAEAKKQARRIEVRSD